MTNMCHRKKNSSKISQTDLEILQFFDFQDGCRPPSWILKFLNIWSPVRLGRLIGLCIVVSNFFKLVTVAEISHLTIFNMAVVRHLGFFKNFIFWTAFGIRGANKRQHTKFRRNRWNNCWDIEIYPFIQDGGRPPFWICGTNFGTTHNENLVVFITVQHLVGKIWLAENWTAFLKLVGSKYKVENKSSQCQS